SPDLFHLGHHPALRRFRRAGARRAGQGPQWRRPLRRRRPLSRTALHARPDPQAAAGHENGLTPAHEAPPAASFPRKREPLLFKTEVPLAPGYRLWAEKIEGAIPLPIPPRKGEGARP